MSVDRVQFELWSPDQIEEYGLFDINVPGTFSNTEPPKGSLNDYRLGPTHPNERCATCGEKGYTCPGHFGFIRLSKPVYHVLFFDMIYRTLQKICISCSHPLGRCKKKCAKCGQAIQKIKKESTHDISANKETLLPSRVRDLFSNIERKHYSSLGWGVPPEWAILTVLAVPPPCVRPGAKMTSGQWTCSDLTYKYSEIIKENNTLKSLLFGQLPLHIVKDTWKKLQWHVSTLFDNGIPALRVSNARRAVPMKGYKQRLWGKAGRIRGNLMGKRVDFSARTVITPDPTLDLDQVGVPTSIALNLTVPEKVTRYNIHHLIERIQRGAMSLDGARYVTRKDGTRYDLRVADLKRLGVGDIVERPIKNDDIVVLNRQPTLHRMSMMSHRVKILPFSTFRLNLSVTTPYNAYVMNTFLNIVVTLY